MGGNAAAGVATPPAMFPLMLDITRVPIFLIGPKDAIASRVATVLDYGARVVHLFSPDFGKSPGAGTSFAPQWPIQEDFAMIMPRLVFLAGGSDEQTARWSDLARSVGAFLHVQDQPALSDFHMPAILRRGRLQITVSTDGVAPGLARLLRDDLANRVFGPEWGSRVDEAAAARDQLRRRGLSMSQLRQTLADLIRGHRWLPPE